MEKEYQKSGVPNGLTWDQFVEQSKSVMVLVYREKQDHLGRAVDKLGEVVRECEEEEARGRVDVHALEEGYGLMGMHCRCVEWHEYDDLDVRVRCEVPKNQHWRVAVPFTSTDEMLEHWNSKLPGPLQRGGFLMELVENGVENFVAVGCEIDPVAVASCLTVKRRPCLPTRVAEAGMREGGKCLRALMLADNGLGFKGLSKLVQGLQEGAMLETLHFVDQAAGELPFSSAGSADSVSLVASLAVVQRLSNCIKERHCSLRVLNLARNGIGPAGVSRIASGLACAENLLTLDLSDNDLGVAGANHIAKALATNRFLTSLNLNRTQVHGLPRPHRASDDD